VNKYHPSYITWGAGCYKEKQKRIWSAIILNIGVQRFNYSWTFEIICFSNSQLPFQQ